MSACACGERERIAMLPKSEKRMRRKQVEVMVRMIRFKRKTNKRKAVNEWTVWLSGRQATDRDKYLRLKKERDWKINEWQADALGRTKMKNDNRAWRWWMLMMIFAVALFWLHLFVHVAICQFWPMSPWIIINRNRCHWINRLKLFCCRLSIYRIRLICYDLEFDNDLCNFFYFLIVIIPILILCVCMQLNL